MSTFLISAQICITLQVPQACANLKLHADLGGITNGHYG